MEVLTQENNTGALSRKFVRSGVAGNFEIIAEMRRVIRNSVNYDKGVEDLAKDLLKNSKLNSYSPPLKQLTTIYDFTRRNVTYIQDKAGLVESIKSARVTLSDGYGDCDDLTVTIATLAGDLGFENVKIAMARYDDSVSVFGHVYPVIYVKNERFVLDATLPDGKINEEIAAVEVVEIPVFEDLEGLDTGLSGLINNIRYRAGKLGRATVETLPLVAGALPLGFIPGKALATSAEMLNHTTAQELSINAAGSKINQQLDAIIVDLVRSQTAHEVAVAQALQAAAQLSTIQNGRRDEDIYQVVKHSVQSKLQFIKDFPQFAKDHNIELIHLNPSAMLTLGIVGAGFGAYTIYKRYKRGSL